MAEKITGAGSGAGAEVTALNESLQAYVCSARAAKGRDISDIEEVNRSNIYNANCTESLGDIKKKLGEDYYHSAITIANQMFHDFPFLNTKTYEFHRGGATVNTIYSTFNKLKSGSNIANANKWNPADIWIIKKGFSIKGDWTTLSDFNSYLREQFYAKNLIGVSLKKLEAGGGAHRQIFNDGEKISARFTGFRIGDDILKSKDVYIEFVSGKKPGEIQLRTFSSRPEPGSWQGEIKGKTAAGGKIGGGVLMRACVECGIPAGQLLYPAAFASHVRHPTESKFNEFANMHKELTGSRESTRNIVTMAKEGQKGDPTWWMTKFLGIHYCHVLYKTKKENKVTNWLYNYGSSATDDSSIFVKYS